MSTTFNGNDNAILLPTQPTGDHERVIVVKPNPGASVELQYQCGSEWVLGKRWDALSVDVICVKGIQTRFVFSGQSVVELGD